MDSSASSSSSSSSKAKSKQPKKLTREQAHRRAQLAAAKQRAAATQKALSSSTTATTTPSNQRRKDKPPSKDKTISTRFRYASFNQRLANLHLAPTAISTSHQIAGLDNPNAPPPSSSSSSIHGSTSFSVALSTWRELNQSLAFQSLYSDLVHITHSLPQLLHHRETISHLLHSSLLDPSRWLAWDAALDLVPRLANDLGSEFIPIYPAALASALSVTTNATKAITGGDDRAAAALVEKAFQSAAWLFKAVSPLIISSSGDIGGDQLERAMSLDTDAAKDQEAEATQKDRLLETWTLVRPYLGWRPPPLPSTSAEDDMEVDHHQQQQDEIESGDDGDEGERNPEAIRDSSEAKRPPTARNNNVPRVAAHTRRFASEAFAHLLRKTKGRQLEAVCTFMLHDLSEWILIEQGDPRAARMGAKKVSSAFARGIAGVWAEACKSVDHRLHSRTPILLKALFVSSSTRSRPHDPRARLRVARLALTSLVHHSFAAHFSPVLELATKTVEQRLDAFKGAGQGGDAATAASELAESIEWLAACVGTRKGTRVPDESKAGLFSLLLRLSPVVDLPRTSSASSLPSSLVTLFVLSFPIGRIQDLIGSGIKLVDSLAPPTSADACERWPEFSALVEALADDSLNWAGFKQFVLPTVLRCTADALHCKADDDLSSTSKDHAIQLLARLQKAGQLDHLSSAPPSPSLTRWSTSVSAEVTRRLERLAEVLRSNGKRSSTAIEQLVPALSLVSLFPSAYKRSAATLRQLVKDLLSDESISSAEKAREDYGRTPFNGPMLLGSVLETLAVLEERATTSSSSACGGLLVETELLSKVTRICAWHRAALAGASRLAQAASSNQQEIRIPSILELEPSLSKVVMSADPLLRTASLELLEMAERYHGNVTAPHEDDIPVGLFSRLLEVERTALAVETVRDRNVRLRAVARELARTSITRSKDDEERAARDRMAIRYMVSSFKINLRPIWGESIKSIAEVAGSSKLSDDVWKVAFGELRDEGEEASTGEALVVPSAWIKAGGGLEQHERDEDLDEDDSEKEADASAPATPGDGKDVDMEDKDDDESDEKQFSDPQLLGRRNMIRACISMARGGQGTVSQTASNAIKAQKPDCRLDLTNYRAQILKLFGEVASLAERHNAEFVELFWQRAGPKGEDRCHSAADDDEGGQEEGDEDEEVEEEEDTVQGDGGGTSVHRLNRKERQAQLCSYLEVFSKFKNPKAMSRSDELHAYFLTLCAAAELSIQKLALDCIATWKSQNIIPYTQKLKDLLDTARFRDALTTFDVSAASETIQPGHRGEFMDLLIRILYGLMVSKRGSRTAGAGQAARKSAILVALAEAKVEELKTLVDLMLVRFKDQLPSFDTKTGDMILAAQKSGCSTRRQNGFLSLLGDTLKYMGAALQPYWSDLVGVTINLTHHAHLSVLESSASAVGTSVSAATAPARSIRQAGYKRITDFFRKPSTFEWSPFLTTLFGSLISPRLPALRVESTQSPSAFMELLHVWASKPETIRLLAAFDGSLLTNLYACLAVTSVKPPVVSRILDIVERIIAVVGFESQGGSDVSVPCLAGISSTRPLVDLLVAPYVSDFLSCVSPLVHRSTTASGAAGNAMGRDELLRREIALLSSLAPFVTSSEDSTHLLELLSPMMRKNNRLVSERTKSELLQIFRHLLLLTPEFRDAKSDMFVKHFELFSSMFAGLRSNVARTSLVDAFAQFVEVDPSLARVCDWSREINSFSTKRIDEPDFDRRLDAFDKINAEGDQAVTLSASEWVPMVNNMLFFIQDAEELAFRSNAGTALRKFVMAVAKVDEDAAAATTAEGSQGQQLRSLFSRTVYPGLKKGLRAKSELVRREILMVISTAVEHLGSLASLDEMRGLLAGGDEEASFFNNVHHIQIHRRARAIRRLGDEAEKGSLRSKTISEVFAPLLGHFLVAGNVELNDHNLVNESISCLAKMSRQLQWGAYNALLWRYLKMANEKTEGEKVFVRTAMAILDSFHFAMEDPTVVVVEGDMEEAGAIEDDEIEAGVQDARSEGPREAGDVEVDLVSGEERESAEVLAARNIRIIDAVTGRLLPRLMGYLEQKDETEDAIRLPIAVGVVRVVQCLPDGPRATHISKLLAALANVLRSKSQETRDMARETISKVAISLGPSHFPEILRELRRALQRGPQLAVLAYTVHALLVHTMTTGPEPVTSIRDGVKDIVHVATEDIFGHTGEDRISIGNKTKAKEVKQSKSMDTFEQLSKIVVPGKMSELLQPLRDILQQTEAPKTVQQVEDCLKRIASGISSNKQFDSHSFLILCHTLIKRDAAFLQPRKPVATAKGKDSAGGVGPKYNYAVLLKRKDVEQSSAGAKDHYSRNAHKFVAFGLDLLLTALRRARFDFSDPSVLAKLQPMVVVVGDTLYAAETSVVNLGLKATAGIVKCPVPSVEKGLPVFIKQILSIVRRAGGSAQSEIVQTALKTLGTILRDCPSAEMKEEQLVQLLKLILPDLEEPVVQSTLFGLLRAIVGRRFVVPEIYDVMDKVAEMMVTNQSSQVRELCRSTFLQFLLDYPQGKGRLKNQLSFLANNLSYVHESGRLSVLELMGAILNKFNDDLLQEHAELFFVALSMLLANDDSVKCREKGAQLLGLLFGVTRRDQMEKMLKMAEAWTLQGRAKPQLCRVGVQVLGILLESGEQNQQEGGWMQEWAVRTLEMLGQILKDCADHLEMLEGSRDDFGFGIDDLGGEEGDAELDWQLAYQAIVTVSKLERGWQSDARISSLLSPVRVSEEGGATRMVLLSSVRRLLLFPHKWVRLASSRLVGSLLSRQSQPVIPLEESGEEDEEEPLLGFKSMVDMSKKLCLQLKSPLLDDELGIQVVKNLVFVAKCFALVPAKGMEEEEEEEENEEEEEEMDEGDKIKENPLAWLFSKLSHQARSSSVKPPIGSGLSAENRWSVQPASILRWFAALASQLDVERVNIFLPHILIPIIRLLMDDGSGVKDPQMGESAMRPILIFVQEHELNESNLASFPHPFLPLLTR
ncbi:hypothetical protein IE53DRAFT_334725 [Violaceomyces palustris]|uniref:Uncharacterized protein n=1 Tax=Violaceomyces palustris TaxID=1673888 RepID=A0ACD0NQ03_9BASI|nr:hypothetical protein IE53DRAFT_334725 [Violaceomyces palustris]